MADGCSRAGPHHVILIFATVQRVETHLQIDGIEETTTLNYDIGGDTGHKDRHLPRTRIGEGAKVGFGYLVKKALTFFDKRRCLYAKSDGCA